MTRVEVGRCISRGGGRGKQQRSRVERCVDGVDGVDEGGGVGRVGS